MTFDDIERLMLKKGIYTDPAFGDGLSIGFDEMPNLNGCPFGLYFPDTASVILPYDAIDAALYHELGHRHGHYYYSDLSEAYAENYRKAIQSGNALLYSGTRFERLPKFGHVFEEGESGVLKVDLDRPLALEQVKVLRDSLSGYGEAPPSINQGWDGNTPYICFGFTKGVDWLSIIGTGMVVSVLFTVGAIGYAVYKVADDMPWIVPTVLWGGLTALLLRAMVKQASKTSK